ncbi:MAG: lysophospholipid acyltransferase family protein [Actinomycetes bacterium]
MRQIGSLVFWTFIVLSSILLFPIAVIIWAVTSPFDKRRVILHRFTCFWASLYTWTNPVWRVSISNRELIDPKGTYVLVANHLSLLDILVLFRLFRDFKWVSKAEIFKVPAVGWNMSLNKYIPLRRGNRESVQEMMGKCEQALDQGSSIMMFPEGTRSKSGQMRDFKPGAFELARSTHTPIIPLVIRGTHDALPARGFVLQGRHVISVTVLPEVPLQVVESMTTTDLTAYVRGLIAAELNEPASPISQPEGSAVKPK